MTATAAHRLRRRNAKIGGSSVWQASQALDKPFAHERMCLVDGHHGNGCGAGSIESLRALGVIASV